MGEYVIGLWHLIFGTLNIVIMGLLLARPHGLVRFPVRCDDVVVRSQKYDALRKQRWCAAKKNLISCLLPSLLQIVGSVTLMRLFPRLISAILLVSALLLPPVVAAWADSDRLSTSGGASVGQVDVISCQDDAARHGEAEDSCCAPEQSCPPQFCVSTCLVPLITGASTHEIPDQETIALRIVKAEYLRSWEIGLLFPPPRT